MNGSGRSLSIGIILNCLQKHFPPTWKTSIFLPSHSFYRSSVRKKFSQHYSFIFPLKPTSPNTNQQQENANRNAQRATILSGHMDFFFKEKEAPLFNSCPQRPLLWHLFPMLFPYLLNPSHQDSGPSTLPPGLSLFSLSSFFFFLIGLSLILWGLCKFIVCGN